MPISNYKANMFCSASTIYATYDELESIVSTNNSKLVYRHLNYYDVLCSNHSMLCAKDWLVRKLFIMWYYAFNENNGNWILLMDKKIQVMWKNNLKTRKWHFYRKPGHPTPKQNNIVVFNEPNKSISSPSHSKDKNFSTGKIPQIYLSLQRMQKIPTSEMTPFKEFWCCAKKLFHLQMFRNNAKNTSRKDDMRRQFVPKVVLDLDC